MQVQYLTGDQGDKVVRLGVGTLNGTSCNVVLANDLALAMRAPSIRVVAPIPGKGAVGVEVPNRQSNCLLNGR